MYFPDSKPRIAVKALLRWIDNCPDLVAALNDINVPFRHKQNLTTRQVRVIMEYLGEPSFFGVKEGARDREAFSTSPVLSC